MYYGIFVRGVRLLDGGRFDHVTALFRDTELNESIVSRRLILDGVQLLFVETVDVTDVPEPGV